ncbi:6-bladed beta-propeller, partial [Algoriphagus algorifonticola]|uniref:6-bladed beta-propeller n=1 Tax=Algoriphagus algorifonticola TaxID=2593007 RepID=UPI00119F084A
MLNIFSINCLPKIGRQFHRKFVQIAYRFFILLFFTIACVEEKSKEIITPINIDLSNPIENSKLSDIFQNPKYTLLKESEENPLVSPYQFQFMKNKIFVRDIDYQNIQIFSSEGEYLDGIYSSGEGPGEFSNINDFFVSDDKIIIQDTNLKKILQFDHEGQFLSEKQHLLNNSNFAFSENKFLFYMSNDPEIEGFNYIFSNDEKETRLLKIEPELENIGKYLQANSFISLGNSNFLFYRPYTFMVNILDSKNEELNKTFLFDFGNFQLKANNHFLSSNDKNRLITSQNLVSQFISVLPIDNFLVISFLRGNKDRYLLIFNQTTQKTSLHVDLENDLSPASLGSPWTTDGNRVYFIIQSIDFFNDYIQKFSGQNVEIKPGNVHEFF